ncbi:MAG: sigma-54 dependent transcriptional regulator [Bryobacteraceae bacterium]
MRKRILIVDDEENIGLSLRLILEREGYTVALANSVAAFRANPGPADAYLVDVRLPDGTGIEILRLIRGAGGSAPVVMISGQATISDAVEATRSGAYDFLEKPLSRDKVLLTVKNALEQRSLRDENTRLREQAAEGAEMIGRAEAWARAVEEATLAARSDARVLLVGESGTGKELLAAHIHASSPFAAGPFVKVNCAAIPTELLETELFGHEKGAFTGAAAARRGKFELADAGTIFLDEVGDLPLPAQAKLLRVLQEGEFHRVGGEEPVRVAVRVVSATNRDLATLAGQQKFREDLYYRLNVMPVRVPPLRERRDDIPLLALYFLEAFCRRNNFRPKGLAPEALELLERWHWPGNVRELRNVVERMAILTPGETIGAGAVPYELRSAEAPPTSIQQARESAERDHIQRALEAASWNVSAAARALGMERTNLHKRIRALGLGRQGQQH